MDSFYGLAMSESAPTQNELSSASFPSQTLPASGSKQLERETVIGVLLSVQTKK